MVVDKSHLVSCLMPFWSQDRWVGDVKLDIQLVITTEGCDVNGFSQLAACFSEEQQIEEGLRRSDWFPFNASLLLLLIPVQKGKRETQILTRKLRLMSPIKDLLYLSVESAAPCN